MAAKINDEPKIKLEREYIVPLRKGWLKVPEYKRASKAIKTLKQFIAKHMKLYDTDLRKVKIDQILNNEIRFRGMRKPPAKIKVKAIKFDNNIIKVELVNIPEHIKFLNLKLEKKKVLIEKKEEGKKETKNKEDSIDEKKDSEDDKETKKETSENKKVSSKDSSKNIEKEHKIQKHTSKEKQIKVNRKTLSR